MKALLCFVTLIAICSADMDALSIGQSCDSSSPFVVTNFVVNPYPPTSGVQLSVNMAGTFSLNEYVSDIAIRTSFNKGAWSYRYIDIAQQFTYGQIYTFTFTMTAGNAVGVYTSEILLERKQGSGISCWSFSYHI